MQEYKNFRPTHNDCAGLGEHDRQDWFVLPCGHNRDSGVLDESNFYSAYNQLKECGEENEDFTVCRFGHWACGWFEIILVRPNTDAHKVAEDIENSLSDYPILDESDHSERERKAADITWLNCYNDAQRLEYIRDNRSQFEFHSFADMLSCVRGKYFAGYASELL